MIYLFSILILLYVIMNAVMIYVWLNEKEIKNEKINSDLTFSIIIPIRNEAQNIIDLLISLENQTYPKPKFEVIIADDSSTDNSIELIQEFQKTSQLSLVINRLSEKKRNFSPKKRAISSSILLANNEIILTTDGDCVVKPNWILSYANFYQNQNIQFAFGSVTFFNKLKSFFEKIQILEFASLAGAAATSLIMNKPNMCSGANMSYRKIAFFEVDGYQGNEHLASGDDEFLMHKMAKNFPNQLAYLKNKDAIVETNALPKLKDFVNQRKRWSSKWKSYDNWQISALAIFIFGVNLSVLLIPFLIQSPMCYYLLMAKFLSESLFIYLIIRFLDKKYTLFYLPFLQLIYPFYVCFFGLLAQKKGFVWKDRNLE
jgi:cellulose synthase/poly-beta-1,6-N-acetylglucosamine synthase-like glycosyltransferase